MKRKGIKNLLIDFGGVLINLDRPRCIENFKKLGLQNVDELLNVYHQQGIFMQQEKGLVTSAEFRDVIRQMVGKPLTGQQIDDAWNSFLVDIPTYKLDLLLKLREKYVVYLLSNTNDIHWKWSFEKIYLSFEMKMVKPDTEIFETVLADANIDPKETFFIDDSEANCLAAQALGISTYTPQANEDWSHIFN